MRDLSDLPLTPTEKLIFGENAKRRPDGSIIEQGLRFTGSDLGNLSPRDGSKVAPLVEEARTIDLRTVHAWPERMQ
jgi:hypothetical protein